MVAYTVMGEGNSILYLYAVYVSGKLVYKWIASFSTAVEDHSCIDKLVLKILLTRRNFWTACWTEPVEHRVTFQLELYCNTVEPV